MATQPRGEGKTHGTGRARGASASAGAVAPVAHSLIEERLFLLTIRCACGGGPYEKAAQSLATEGERQIDVVRVRCPRCAADREFRFDVTAFIGRFYPRRGISDTDEPSSLLDAVAWVRWARTYLRAFEGERSGLDGDDKADCGILALRCLDEALKQFRPGEPLLLEPELFTPGSAEAFHAGADRYTRYEILGLKLQASMLLAASGADPDARDPGAVAGGVMRLSGALSPARPPGDSGDDLVAHRPAPRPSMLGAPAPAALALPAPRRRGAEDVPVAATPSRALLYTILCVAGVLAAMALAGIAGRPLAEALGSLLRAH